MRLNLTAKFVAGFFAASVLALGAHAWLRVQREQAFFAEQQRSHAARFARSLADGVEALHALFGAQRALLLLDQVNQSSPQLHARWVTLEARSDWLPAPALPLEQLAAVQRGEPHSIEVPDPAGGPGLLLSYAPLGEAAYLGRSALEVAESLREQREFARGALRSTLLFSATALVLTSAVAAGVGVLFIGRPIRVLVEKAQRISAGDLSGPVVLRQRDELALLAAEMNAMCERLAQARGKVESETAARIAALEQLRHTDRLATVGRLAAGIAHEIGTPLAVAGGRIAMVASRELEGAQAVQSAQIAGEQLQRISAIIRQLLDFARSRPAQKGPVELHALAARCCRLLEPLAAKRGVQLAVQPAPTAGAQAPGASAQALGDLGQLEQALTNLIVNALQACSPGGCVEISCASARATPPPQLGGAEADMLALCVADNGSGMSAETRSHIFEPFFTTKEVGQGSGLGLAVTYGIVREHDGWIDVESELGRGSRFTVYLPRA